MRVPFGEFPAPLHFVPVGDEQARPVAHAVPAALAALLVGQHDLAIAARRHDRPVGRGHRAVVLDPRRPVDLALDAGLPGALRDRAADVEGPHGELGAGLADRLGGDDADRLAHVHHRPARQVAAVAAGAHAALGLASERRTHPDALDPRLLQRGDGLLVDQAAGGNQDAAAAGIFHVDRGAAAEDAVGQRLDDVAAVHHVGDLQPLLGSAVLLGDDDVLGYVDEAARQVAGIGGLQRRVGEALAGAVGRVEILEHGQPLLEVGHDRRLDDLAGGLGHQPPHAGELLHLCGGAARARIGHHVD